VELIREPLVLYVKGCSSASQALKFARVFEGALISASSLGLASFFGSIISHVRSSHNTTTLCSYHDHHLSSERYRLKE
jgi:hypothetical protein